MYDCPSCSSKLSVAACPQTDDTPLLALDDESKQTFLNGPTLCRKKHLLSLNPKFNHRSPQLCETPNRISRQTETRTPELGEFVKNAVETSTPGATRKLPVQEREKDNDAVLMANRPKWWRLSDFGDTINVDNYKEARYIVS
ncbi:hypothetical protein GQX74_005756 [Glossina fuscipes]|nr:hypothetical protein GQX74_005756 [Glossina fuscipes]